MKQNRIAPRQAAILARSFLFRGLRGEELPALLCGLGECAAFSRGQVIYDRNHYRQSVGILLAGAAEAFQQREAGRVVLNRFSPSMIFGAAAVFGDGGDYVAQVAAAPRCTVFFLSGAELSLLFQRDFRVAENYIVFLTQRIQFLNRKIDGFTLSSAEEKLALYLSDALQQGGGGSELLLPCSLAELARRLDISRASLYRSLESLTRAGALERRGKSLLIRDPDLLKKHRKEQV